MKQRPLTLIDGDDVIGLLRHREDDVMKVVRSAYQLHGRGESSLPHSSFLRFPGRERERIISLPGYLGGDARVAGVKWIASFPENISRGEERASALLVLNDVESGFPFAVIESSAISAKRTAASAVVAARTIWGNAAWGEIGIIGCGRINYEILNFLSALSSGASGVILYDQDEARAVQFSESRLLRKLAPRVQVASTLEELLSEASLVSLATTAVKPHIFELPTRTERQLILNVSLRDLGPELVARSSNVVDDIDHVARANTSIHLAEQLTGNRDFVNGEIHQLLSGEMTGEAMMKGTTIFSPFGLGVLDLAVGKLVFELAKQEGSGRQLDSFFPAPWTTCFE